MSDTIKQDPGHSDLPLGNPAEAAKLLAGMRNFDPLTALNELGAWLDAIKGIPDDEEKVRGEILSLVQEAGGAHVSALLAKFLAQPKGKQEDWNTLNDYVKELAGALCASARTLLKQSATTSSLQLPGAAGAARGLHAARTLAKVHLLRYFSVPPKLWRLAYAVHGDAEKTGCATIPVHLHAAQKTTTTVAQELLRMLMLQSSSPEMMPPEHIEVADCVVEQLGDFTLRPRGVADNPFCFDPASDHPPHRAPGESPGPDSEIRYFGAGAGYDALDRLYKQLAATGTADIRPLGKDIPIHVQVSAIKHLLVFWGLAAPYSPPARTPAAGNLQVIHGYGQIWQHLSSHAGSGATELSLVEDGDGAAQAPETWAQHDAGGNELGAEVPLRSRDWARIGYMVGVTMQGSNESWLGVIRSMHAEPGRGLHAEIFVLSHQPRAVQLRPVIAKGEESIVSENAARQFDFKSVRAIIVSDGAGGSQTANFLLPADSWQEGRVYEATIGGATRFLRSLQLLRRGDDYVRATFEWMQQQ